MLGVFPNNCQNNSDKPVHPVILEEMLNHCENIEVDEVQQVILGVFLNDYENNPEQSMYGRMEGILEVGKYCYYHNISILLV
jgi:hypothetical protein